MTYKEYIIQHNFENYQLPKYQSSESQYHIEMII